MKYVQFSYRQVDPDSTVSMKQDKLMNEGIKALVSFLKDVEVAVKPAWGPEDGMWLTDHDSYERVETFQVTIAADEKKVALIKKSFGDLEKKLEALCSKYSTPKNKQHLPYAHLGKVLDKKPSWVDEPILEFLGYYE